MYKTSCTVSEAEGLSSMTGEQALLQAALAWNKGKRRRPKRVSRMQSSSANRTVAHELMSANTSKPKPKPREMNIGGSKKLEDQRLANKYGADVRRFEISSKHRR